MRYLYGSVITVTWLIMQYTANLAEDNFWIHIANAGLIFYMAQTIWKLDIRNRKYKKDEEGRV